VCAVHYTPLPPIILYAITLFVSASLPARCSDLKKKNCLKSDFTIVCAVAPPSPLEKKESAIANKGLFVAFIQAMLLDNDVNLFGRRNYFFNFSTSCI